jgi:hypothetical protein
MNSKNSKNTEPEKLVLSPKHHGEILTAILNFSARDVQIQPINSINNAKGREVIHKIQFEKKAKPRGIKQQLTFFDENPEFGASARNPCWLKAKPAA